MYVYTHSTLLLRELTRSLCFSRFECHANPSGRKTLAAFRDVHCDEEEWKGLRVLSALHMLLFVFAP